MIVGSGARTGGEQVLEYSLSDGLQQVYCNEAQTVTCSVGRLSVNEQNQLLDTASEFLFIITQCVFF